jgi:hypothetical protein
MSGNEPTFRWDSFGISAYDTYLYDSGINQTISGINTKKFVRFDKYGIYGINGGADGASWHPLNEQDIENKSSYHLTWDSFKITPENIGYSTAYDKNGNKIELVSPITPNRNSIKIGKVDDLIFNSWTSNGLPFYDVDKTGGFVKILSVG